MHPLVNKLGLEPHPEGGYYRQIYRSATQVSSPKHGLPRPAVTHIYFLLLKGQVSRFHRVLHDEIWNHYDGAPLTLYQLHQQQLHENALADQRMIWQLWSPEATIRQPLVPETTRW